MPSSRCPTSRCPHPTRHPAGAWRSCALLALVLLTGCGPGWDGETFIIPDEVTVEAPDAPLVHMEIVEDSTEDVANRMLGFSDKLRRRDFDAAADWMTPDFAGHGFSGLDCSLVAAFGITGAR